MNRRNFLRLVGAGLPAAVITEKIGPLEKVRSYFFAPKQGWAISCPEALAAHLHYLHGLRYDPDELYVSTTGTMYGISRSEYPKLDTGKAVRLQSYPEVDFDKALLIG